MEYEIKHGLIRVADVNHYISERNFHVFEVDLDSKYPNPVVPVWEEGVCRVFIPAGARTLHTRAMTGKRSETEVVFQADSQDWQVLIGQGKYEVRIAFYRNELI